MHISVDVGHVPALQEPPPVAKPHGHEQSFGLGFEQVAQAAIPSTVDTQQVVPVAQHNVFVPAHVVVEGAQPDEDEDVVEVQPQPVGNGIPSTVV